MEKRIEQLEASVRGLTREIQTLKKGGPSKEGTSPGKPRLFQPKESLWSALSPISEKENQTAISASDGLDEQSLV